ncbi:MAG: hypothetical protein IPK82_40765 [Polyangiaceae bacterium]|nr:hypothetical protein [Polyangiaceae bacterium]
MNQTPLRLKSCLPVGFVSLAALGIVASGCQDRPICPVVPISTAVVSERLATSFVSKVDIVLAVDNSRSMSDKQRLLALAIPDLVEGLVNPPCLDFNAQPIIPTPKSPLDPCPAGAHRAFEPILDIHIGVITSSLGSYGADACSPTGAGKHSNDDKGHLVYRSDPTLSDTLPTYQNLGFLAWDPAQISAPPGEGDLHEDSPLDPDSTALIPVLRDMIAGAGDVGCGYESQLESWYRFLVDPEPPAGFEINKDGKAVSTGIDNELLAQRKAFLRPDSLLAIVMLTDENDCSLDDSGFAYPAFKQKTGEGASYHLPRPRQECASNPGDPCCYSCAQPTQKDAQGNDCPADPMCTNADGTVARLTEAEDPINLRCWDQKRRFGIDLLQPISRYKKALTQPTVLTRSGKVEPNPIFSDLDPTDKLKALRTSSMVVVTAIAGVPWQDIANDPTDLTKGFKSSDELEFADKSGKTGWDIILGEPAKGIPPADPLMVESPDIRSGTHPITGEPIATPDTPLKNTINGHDFGTWDDLNYACIFDLLEPVACSVENYQYCRDQDTSPVYDPPYISDPTYQVRAGARPGTRILELMKEIGYQGVVASACPAQTVDPTRADFGYRPAITAALKRLEAQIDGGCLSRSLSTDTEGLANCAVIEARLTEPSGACCDAGQARLVPAPEREQLVKAIGTDPAVVAREFDCFCEIPQLTGTEPGQPLYLCQNDLNEYPLDENGEQINGYCYLDAMSEPKVGNPDLLNTCPSTEKRMLRFVGKGHPRPNSVLFLACGVDREPISEECK